ncbi:hypothetical protein [Polyangium sorediatum]|uniref:Outer membrane protein beta-barrel domain-containing protein n=1 Tax=Polyangium sorediatum TaxID=889274 RepID=A0ABT6P4W8_9BACT|nr:hypothetical protein [Polyangium sorediatum]MDI1435579.1 hypothetical protein [Polyangium sorediatum]
MLIQFVHRAKLPSVGAALAAFFVTTSLCAAEPTPPAPPGDAWGFVLGTNLSAVLLDDDVLREEVMVGFKFGRLVLGVSGYYLDQDLEMPREFGHAHTKEKTFLVGPEAQVALVRSANGRTELIGMLGGAAGTWDRWSTKTDWVGGSPLGGTATPVTTEESGQGVRVRWHAGLGVRFWLLPRFGFHVAAGALGDYRLKGSGTFDELPATGFFQAGFLGVAGADAAPKEPRRQGSPDIGFAIQSGISTSPRAPFDASLGLGVNLYRFLLVIAAEVPLLVNFGTVVPGIELQGTAFRSADRRVEFFGSGFIGSSLPSVNSAFRWKFAPGVRLWPRPDLALTATVGVMRDEYRLLVDASNPGEFHDHFTMFGRIGILSVVGL